jgi:hypothetical protein
MKILKKEIHKKENYFSILIEDEKNNIKFWIDCSLIDGYGKHDDNGNYIDWEFNQYIFDNYNEEDERQKAYQENANNLDCLYEFINEEEYNLVKWYKTARGGNNEK